MKVYTTVLKWFADNFFWVVSTLAMLMIGSGCMLIIKNELWTVILGYVLLLPGVFGVVFVVHTFYETIKKSRDMIADGEATFRVCIVQWATVLRRIRELMSVEKEEKVNFTETLKELDALMQAGGFELYVRAEKHFVENAGRDYARDLEWVLPKRKETAT